MPGLTPHFESDAGIILYVLEIRRQGPAPRSMPVHQDVIREAPRLTGAGGNDVLRSFRRTSGK